MKNMNSFNQFFKPVKFLIMKSLIFKSAMALMFVFFCSSDLANAQFINNGQTGGANRTYLEHSAGRVGIGTTAPGAKFHAMGEVRASLGSNWGRYISMGHGGSNAYILWRGAEGQDLDFRFAKVPQTGNSTVYNKMRLTGNGELCIGTTNEFVPTNPTGSNVDYKLFVNGGGLFTEVKVEAGWADYVFDKDYNLLSLESVAQHIDENGFLPNTPSSEEYAEMGGVEIGAATVKQQEKIEELFLHLIEMNEAVKSLQSEVSNLKEEKVQIEQELKNIKK